MFSFLSPSKKRMFVLVRLLFRSDEKRQALQQHTHLFFSRWVLQKTKKTLFDNKNSAAAGSPTWTFRPKEKG
jgi:hypothetical protein